MSKTYPILVVVALLAAPALADWDEGDPYKWAQLPDLTPTGIDIKVDQGFLLADDFLCTTIEKITDVHLWGSWRDDLPGNILKVHLSIHADVPAISDPSEGLYVPSHPGPLLWAKDLVPEDVYDTARDPGFFLLRPVADLTPEWEGWWAPPGEWEPDGDQIVWQLNAFIDEEDAFLQQGTPSRPIVYWLDVSVEVESPAGGPLAEFGWKTSMEHWNDDAVIWNPTGGWDELRYPPGHPLHVPFDIEFPERGSIDLAFVITPEPATLAMLMLGAGMAFMKRRRR